MLAVDINKLLLSVEAREACRARDTHVIGELVSAGWNAKFGVSVGVLARVELHGQVRVGLHAGDSQGQQRRGERELHDESVRRGWRRAGGGSRECA